MPNYVSLTESQRRKIAVFITESQQQAQQQQQLQAGSANGDDSVISTAALSGGSPGGSSPIVGSNAISCKEIVQFCKTRFGLTISLSTASRLRSTAQERLATELLNPSAKRHRSVKFPEFEKALVQELKALEQEQFQIQQEQDRQAGATTPIDPSQLPPVMTLTSEAAITQVAKGIAERMGISESELGLTSGWYHGFKRRHGIKHRQLKSRSGAVSNGNSGNTVASGLGVPNLSSISAGAPGNIMEGGDGSDGPDGDEEMEDANQEMTDPNEKLGLSGDIPTANVQTPLGFMKEATRAVTPPMASKDSPSSLSRRPEVKKVTAATANDSLDVISEYLLQNGQIGATKLPLVKELRKFLLSQTELENGVPNTSASFLLSVSSLASVSGNPVFASGSNPSSELPGTDPVPLMGANPVSSFGIMPAKLEATQPPMALPTGDLTTMEGVFQTQEQQQQQQQQQEQQQEQQ
ncbi:hypothetical protein BGW38_009311 [Lunasporangiospora selenospora]|uniref:HTH CENPB-type domain-containing protein n=1 Tax=Lunasporangiospora selenospora TaxID=979761 RepID=A0A9P6FZD2_9FUNG|nr:hypothetical protein BGW38_009311 [Lunasporangiospora selenospora]